MYGKEKVSLWKRFRCFFGHNMVETSRIPHDDRDFVTLRENRIADLGRKTSR